jgi:hypothetical protein
MASGRIREGQKVMLVAFGAGLTWTSSLVAGGYGFRDQALPAIILFLLHWSLVRVIAWLFLSVLIASVGCLLAGLVLAPRDGWWYLSILTFGPSALALVIMLWSAVTFVRARNRTSSGPVRRYIPEETELS